MIEGLELAPLLLAPVAALLFLSLYKSRKLRYPHDLLEPEARRGRASLLFRSFRGRYDVALDAAIALVLAFALPRSYAPEGGAVSTGRRPSAVVLDCSRSMASGARGERPLDRALARLASDPSLSGAEGFALAFDPGAMRARLLPLSRAARFSRARRGEGRRGADPADLADALLEDLPFFAVDYGALAGLRERGYGRVTLITDELGAGAAGIDLVEVGGGRGIAAFPTAARYDPASESWVAALAERPPRGEIRAFARSGAGRLEPLPSSRCAIEDRGAGRLLRFPASGFYVVSISDPGGGQGVDLAFAFRPSAARYAASGPFSERMASVFPFLERSGAPELALSDLGSAKPSAPRSIVTAILPSDGPCVLDPALSGGRPIAAAFAKGADFALGPSSIANDDLPLAYYSAMRDLEPPAFATAAPPGTRSLTKLGSIFVADTDRGLVPLIPPASEFFGPSDAASFSIPPAREPRWPWALALAALAASKLAISLLLSRRRPVA